MFIKVTGEYSIAIGSKGNHNPNKEWNKLDRTQYVKSNDVSPVMRVGKLIFD